MKIKECKFGYEDPIYFIKNGKKYNIKIWQDEDPMNPRDYSNVCTMACWHNRYVLGDNIGENKPVKYIQDLIVAYLDKDINDLPEDITELLDIIQESDALSFKFLYLYDHSGITISLSDFGDPWDSGKVGIIWASKKDILNNYPDTDPTNWKEKAYARMKTEVQEYDCYVTGDMYGYTLYETVQHKTYCQHCGEVIDEYDEDEDIENIGSYYGYDEVMQDIIRQYGECELQ